MSSIKYFLLLPLFFLFFHGSNGAKILSLFTIPSKSHCILGETLMKTLADRGHEVTMVSSFPRKTPYPNYTDINLHSVRDFLKNQMNDVLDILSIPQFLLVSSTFYFGFDMTRLVLKDENFQELLRKNDSYDVIIVDTFINEPLFGVGYHFKAPVISFMSAGPSFYTGDITGNYMNPAYVPQPMMTYSDEMTFLQRLDNTYEAVLAYFVRTFIYLPLQNYLLQTYFPDAPDIYTTMSNVALTLSNTHTSYMYPIPSISNTIEIGGFHIPETKKLPKDLQEYLDSATDGAIYLSLGSNVQSSNLTPYMRQAFMNAFKRLKQKILWKWDQATIEGQPDNLKLGKWFPQPDVLAHPNVKLFITHGGLGSVAESIWHSVPMIGVPFFGDQPLNIHRIVDYEMGLKLNLKNVTEHSIYEIITEVITNKKYADSVRLHSKLYRDQSVPPKEKAAYWIEYVIRHKGAAHLRPAALDLYWFQFYLLDVIGFISFVVFMVLLILYFLIKLLKNVVKYCFKSIVRVFGCTSQKKKQKVL